MFYLIVSAENPADLSSVETIIELYENVEVNVVDDSLFKLIMEI